VAVVEENFHLQHQQLLDILEVLAAAAAQLLRFHLLVVVLELLVKEILVDMVNIIHPFMLLLEVVAEQEDKVIQWELLVLVHLHMVALVVTDYHIVLQEHQ